MLLLLLYIAQNFVSVKPIQEDKVPEAPGALGVLYMIRHEIKHMSKWGLVWKLENTADVVKLGKNK